MKIYWLSHRDIRHPKAGGAERTAFEVLRRLAKRGHSAKWLSVGWTGTPESETIGNVEIVRARSNFRSHLSAPLYVLQQKDRPVVVDDLAHVVPWGSPLVGVKRGVAFFRHLHARTLPGQTSGSTASLLALLERSYPLVYAHWPFVTEAATSVADLRALGVQSNRIHTIPPGVDRDLFRPRERTQIPQLVYFSGMRPYKRPDLAIEMLLRVKIAGLKARLVMIGEGPMLPTLRTECARLGLQDDVAFLGRIGYRDVASVVGSSWVNLQTSVAEGWGYSTLESASAGVPTVGFRAPGIEDSVLQGVSGTLLEDMDFEGVTAAIFDAVEHPSLWVFRCLGYAQRFEWESSVTQWERMFTGL